MIDYAETRVGLRDLLRELAMASGVVRVLLLARSGGEWWERLSTGDIGIRALLRNAHNGVPLAEVVASDVSDAELMEAAVPRFAAALGVTAPESVELASNAGRARILDLHAAALVAVLHARHIRQQDQGATTIVRVQVAGVLGELLEHEAKFWMGAADRAGLFQGAVGLTPEVVRRMVAAGALLGADSEAEAVDLLGRVPGAPRTVRLAHWLRDLYPPYPELPGTRYGHWLGLLQPDRLAEHHTVTELTASPQLAEGCLSHLSDRQALRAVTLLGRASTEDASAKALLERILPLVERIVAELPADAQLLAAISAAMPYPSLTFAATDAAVIERIIEILPPAPSSQRGTWLTVLGGRYWQLGRPDDSLRLLQEAVKVFRELAETDPDTHRPNLANSLAILGSQFSMQSHPEDALRVMREAVEIFRELAEADPDTYRPELAGSLSDLGFFIGTNRPEFALHATQEAVEIFRELAEADPDTYRAKLADTLVGLGKRFIQTNQAEVALHATQEAVEIFRELAVADPDTYRPELADTLAGLGRLFIQTSRREDALHATQEAVEIFRELAEADPETYRPELADTLTILGLLFSVQKNRPEDALRAAQDAIEIFRELAVIDPDAHRPNLARSLAALGSQFTQTDHSGEALRATREAVEIFRELAVIDPDAHRPNLADTLSTLGSRLTQTDHPDEALRATREAVEIFRELAVIDPDAHRPNLADTLSTLGSRLTQTDHPDEALRATREAVEIFRELAETDPDTHRPNLADTLSLLGLLLSVQRHPDALRASQEAVEIFRELAETDPDTHRPNLVRSLVIEGSVRLYFDQTREATRCVAEAHEIAGEQEPVDIPNLVADALRRSYEQDADGIQTAWHEVTSKELPPWLH
ncbi:tetratricopeptide repeat protein [Actinomadura luteofluorescens]|uniref:tetratricopeptide repeat protein n=1 Tax=Actinomadura luteofluorescens TaxID=46163 RepID=UPI003D913CAA